MQSLFKKYLLDRNIKITKEEDGKLSFHLGDLNFIFVYEAGNTTYFRLMLPNLYDVEEHEMAAFENVTNNITRRFKVAKAYINEDRTIWLSAEQFVFSAINVDMLFTCCIDLMKAVYDTIKEDIINQVNSNPDD